jgi:hypothetical protein
MVMFDRSFVRKGKIIVLAFHQAIKPWRVLFVLQSISAPDFPFHFVMRIITKAPKAAVMLQRSI